MTQWGSVAIFLLKILVGFGLFMVYTYHYQYRTESDSFRYFDDAMVVYGALFENPVHYFRFIFGINLDAPEMAIYFEQMGSWKSSYNYGITNDNPTVIRLNAIIALFSFGKYHVHTVFFCFFSTLGGIGLFKAFRKFISTPWLLFAAVFCLPSVIFWSSGVMKEAPLMLALGMLIYGFFRLVFIAFSSRILGLTLVALLFLVFLKEYVLIAMLAGLIFLVICKLRSWKNVIPIFVFSHVVMALVAFNAAVIYPPGDFLYILQKKQTDFYNVAEEKGAGSLIEIPEVGDAKDFIVQAPASLYRAYLRPDFREIDSVFHAACSAENVLLFAAFILMLFSFRRLREKDLAVVLFCLSFAIVLGLIIGNTVPVLGAVVRYKMPALPFLFLAFLMLSRHSQIKAEGVA